MLNRNNHWLTDSLRHTGRKKIGRSKKLARVFWKQLLKGLKFLETLHCIFLALLTSIVRPTAPIPCPAPSLVHLCWLWAWPSDFNMLVFRHFAKYHLKAFRNYWGGGGAVPCLMATIAIRAPDWSSNWLAGWLTSWLISDCLNIWPKEGHAESLTYLFNL